MKHIIEGIEYTAVPSAACRSKVGNVRCSVFNASSACEALKCMGKSEEEHDVCFLDNEAYTRWLTAKLTT